MLALYHKREMLMQLVLPPLRVMQRAVQLAVVNKVADPEDRAVLADLRDFVKNRIDQFRGNMLHHVGADASIHGKRIFKVRYRADDERVVAANNGVEAVLGNIDADGVIAGFEQNRQEPAGPTANVGDCRAVSTNTLALTKIELFQLAKDVVLRVNRRRSLPIGRVAPLLVVGSAERQVQRDFPALRFRL